MHCLTSIVSGPRLAGNFNCWLNLVFRVRGERLPFSGGFLSFVRFFSTMPRSCSTPMESLRACHGARNDAAFPLTLQGRLPRPASYGAVSILREMRTPLRPGRFPVYASPMLFPRGVVLTSMVLVTRFSSRDFIDLANIDATLGSYYWLGFTTYGLSPYKKRLALLGA